MDELPSACQKVLDAASESGLAIEIRLMNDTTRTAEEAAAACGCAVAQIVKSLVFTGKETGVDYLLLVSGANRVDEAGVAAHLGEPLKRPRGEHVRDVTGFAIGGIPPFGHANRLRTFMDEDLLAFPEVWAAAGTPNAVFAADPAAIRDATQASVIRVA
ncbi:MAG: YbaK/EbsC family protein [Salinarimonadaceae bacterium]|nr:MAG: YbaK/EbsC family protein [Salinarimonadaceae bacterium]